MDEQGLSRTANDKASVSINQTVVPDVQDWDALYAHITKTQDFAASTTAGIVDCIQGASETQCKQFLVWRPVKFDALTFVPYKHES